MIHVRGINDPGKVQYVRVEFFRFVQGEFFGRFRVFCLRGEQMLEMVIECLCGSEHSACALIRGNKHDEQTSERDYRCKVMCMRQNTTRRITLCPHQPSEASPRINLSSLEQHSLEQAFYIHIRSLFVCLSSRWMDVFQFVFSGKAKHIDDSFCSYENQNVLSDEVRRR